jgi:hypothetical protein
VNCIDTHPASFTDHDIHDLRYSAQIIKSVEASHLNVGMQTVILKLFDLANLGLLLLGSRGCCKTDSLNGLEKSLLHRPYYELSVQTVAALAKKANNTLIQRFDHGNLTVINPDFSSPNKYARGLILNLFSALISDHRYGYNTQTGTFSISNCHCSFLSAVQPIIYAQIVHVAEWEGVYKDRFLRYLILFPQPYEPKSYPPKPDRPATLDRLDPPAELDVEPSLRDLPEYQSLREVLEMQI